VLRLLWTGSQLAEALEIAPLTARVPQLFFLREARAALSSIESSFDRLFCVMFYLRLSVPPIMWFTRTCQPAKAGDGARRGGGKHEGLRPLGSIASAETT